MRKLNTTVFGVLMASALLSQGSHAMKEDKDLIRDVSSPSMPSCLNPEERPPEVNKAIEEAYNKIKITKSDVKYNYRGSPSYNFLNVHEFSVIEKVLRTSNPQNVFRIMDVGSGNGTWPRTCLKYLNELKDLPKNTRVEIISMSGGDEDNFVEKTEEGICTLYEYSQFKIEDLNKELKKRGHDVENQVDVIVSAYTLNQLVDPWGMLVRLFNDLRPTSGLLFMSDVTQSIDSRDILEMIGVPFLESQLFIKYNPLDDTEGRSFLLKRNTEKKCSLPFSYNGMWEDGGRKKTVYANNGKNMIWKDFPCIFEGALPEGYVFYKKGFDSVIHKGSIRFFGNEELYEFVSREDTK